MTTQQEAPEPGRIPEFHLGDRMAKALDHAGIGRGEMAEFMDVSTETIRRWTSMSGPVRRSTLRLWAMRTGVSLEWLETGQAPTHEESRPDEVLPRLDSNQQPSGYLSLLVNEANIVDLAAFRATRAA